MKKQMTLFTKKGMAVFMAAVMLGTGLTGCGNEKESEDKETVETAKMDKDVEDTEVDKKTSVDNEENLENDTAGNKEDEEILAVNSNEDEEDNTDSEMYVTSKNFKLKDGFIVGVDKKTTAQSGYIEVATYDDFNAIRGNASGKYILMSDIEFSSDYESIEKFTGELDGNGYELKNVPVSVFNELDGKVSNLGINVNIDQDCSESGWLSSIGGLTIEIQKEACIDNCYLSGKIHTKNVNGNGVGGFAGRVGYVNYPYENSDLLISNSYSASEIEVDGVNCYVGGFVGNPSTNTFYGKIINCINEGSITVKNQDGSNDHIVVGGLVASSTAITMENCCNKGMLNVECVGTDRNVHRDVVGGLIGEASFCDSIRHCNNSGDITVSCAFESVKKVDSISDINTQIVNAGCGGIVGSIRNVNEIYGCWNTGNIVGKGSAGGIVGNCYTVPPTEKCNLEITNCYNLGNVKSDLFTGGLLGWMESSGRESEISHCYNASDNLEGKKTGQLAGETTSDDVIIDYCYYRSDGPGATCYSPKFATVAALGESEMKQEKSYEDFDFDNVWTMDSENGMPKLQNYKESSKN